MRVQSTSSKYNRDSTTKPKLPKRIASVLEEYSCGMTVKIAMGRQNVTEEACKNTYGDDEVLRLDTPGEPQQFGVFCGDVPKQPEDLHTFSCQEDYVQTQRTAGCDTSSDDTSSLLLVFGSTFQMLIPRLDNLG